VLAAAMVRLKENNNADLYRDGKVVARKEPTTGELIEEEVYKALKNQAGGPVDLKALIQAVRDVEATRFAGLQEEGLVPGPAARVASRAIPFLLTFGAIFLFGISRLLMGLANDKPVGFLVFALVATFIVTLIVFGRKVGRTRKADGVLANLSQQRGGLRKLSSGVQPGDAPMAVALFGVGVLAGTGYASLHSRMQKFDSVGSGGGCGSSGCSSSGCGGGGGCSGGGCGGCGGGGGD
jgi:uncharacterized protein (TIGR04222 family)